MEVVRIEMVHVEVIRWGAFLTQWLRKVFRQLENTTICHRIIARVGSFFPVPRPLFENLSCNWLSALTYLKLNLDCGCDVAGPNS